MVWIEAVVKKFRRGCAHSISEGLAWRARATSKMRAMRDRLLKPHHLLLLAPIFFCEILQPLQLDIQRAHKYCILSLTRQTSLEDDYLQGMQIALTSAQLSCLPPCT